MQSLPPDHVPQQELYLVQYGKLSYADIQAMPIYERLWWVNQTSSIIEEQNRKIEEEERRAKAQASRR